MPQGPAVLQSYVTGAWRSPEGDGRPVLDASTGEVVCLVSSDGIDAGAALAYGRSVGGPALRALTFHERAAMLKSLATHLHERREDLHACCGLVCERRDDGADRRRIREAESNDRRCQ